MGGISSWTFNEWVCAAEELLEDFEVVSLVGVTGKLVLSLRNSVLETVLTVLVIDAFHEWVGEDLVGFAQPGELKVRLRLVLSWVAHWVVNQSKLAVSCCDFLTVCCGVNSESDVISALVSVHYGGRFYFLL